MNISVKKFSKKSLSLLIALIMVFSALPLTPSISAEAATKNVTTTTSSFQVIVNSGPNNRYYSSGNGTYGVGAINVCNDGGNDNFCAAWYGFSLSDFSGLENYSVAKITIPIKEILAGSSGIEVYATNKSLTNTATSTKSGYTFGYYSIGTSYSGDTAKTYVKDTLFGDTIHLGTYSNTSNSNQTNVTINYEINSISSAINSAIEKKWSNFNILILNVGTSRSGSNWSDTWVQPPTITVTGTEITSSTEVTSSNNANSTTNRVKIGDAIYTYESSSAYYNYGKTISTESPWNTPISTTKPISSVECMDDGSVLTVSSDLLSGSLKGDKFAVDTDTNVNATLKFTFRDGKIEYHRVAVKSYPIESHGCVYAWRSSGYKENGFTLYARNSIGSGGKGLFVDYKKYYGTYSASGTTALGKNADSADVILAGVDKKAGTGYTAQSQALNSAPSIASYYIDKSCFNTAWRSLGNSELWNGTQYQIKLDIVRTKFFHVLGNIENKALQKNTTGAVFSGTYSKNDTNGATSTLTLTGSNNIVKASDYNFQYNVQTHDQGSSCMTANIEAFVFDKSVARNKYVEYINEGLTEGSYTASSFAAYQNALLDMEAYLSNYEDTTTATSSQEVYTNLVNAYNGLTARGDISALEAAYAKYKDITTNRNKYTTDSYNSWKSEIAFDSTLIAYEQLTAEQKRDLTASDVETYKAPFDKLNYELLVLRADLSVFSNLDNQVTIAREKLSLDNVNYTENSKIALQNALDNATYKDYTDSQKANTPKSVETDIYNQYLNIFNAITALAYDKTSQQDVYNAYVEAKNSKNESCYTSSDWQNYTLRIQDLATWLADDTNGNITEFNSLVTTLDNTIATIEANHRTNHYKYVYDRVNNQHTYACENNCSVDAPVTSDCTYNYFTANHISTAECSACKGGYSLDYTAFDAKVEDLNTKLQETTKYSNTASCKKKLDEITALSTAFTKVTTQEELDALINRLTDEVENALQIAVYSITLNFFDENGKPLGIGENGSTSKIYSGLTYGALQNVQVPLRYNNIDYTVVKWTRHENGDAITGFNSSSIDVIVKGKCEYNVYLKRITAENINQDTTVVVTLKNKSNKTVDIGYVTKSTEAQSVTVDVSERTIRIGDVILTAPAYSFYNLIGFDINDTTITESGSVVFDSNTVIIPIYTSSKSFTITRGTGDYNNFTINGKDEASYTAKWNEEVVLKAPEKVLWCTGNRVNPIVLSYSQEYVFYANKAMSIFAINPVLSFDVSTDPTASVGYFDYDVELNRVTVVNNFFAVDLSKVEKAGVVLSTKTGNRDTLMTQTNGRFEGTPDKFTKNGNQLRVSVSRTAHTSFTMYALAYVVVNGKTYYSSEVSQYTYTATTA